MIKVANEERPRPHRAVETAFLAPEAVLWDGRHAQVHHLNPAATAVWLCLDGKLTADGIATELSEIFEMPRDLIRSDVDLAITEFTRLGLLDDAGESDSEPRRNHPDHVHHHDDPAGKASDDAGVTVLARPPDP